MLARIKEKITTYVELYISLFKLEFIGRTANVLSYFIYILIGLFIVFCILLFVGFGLAETFFALGLSKLASFLATIGVYMLLLIAFVILRRRITHFFSSSIVQVLTEGDESGTNQDKADTPS